MLNKLFQCLQLNFLQLFKSRNITCKQERLTALQFLTKTESEWHLENSVFVQVHWMQCHQLLCGEVTTSELSLGRFSIISLMLCLVQDNGKKKIPVLKKWRQTIKRNKVNTLYGIWRNYFSCLIFHFDGDNTQFGVNVLFKTNWLKIWGFYLFLPIPKFTF